MRLLSRLSVLAAGAALAACMTLPDGGEPARIDPDRLSAHVQALSDDSFEGRGIATPAEDKVIAYLSEAFADAGFEPGGENGGWTQAVTLNRFAVSNVSASFSDDGVARPLTQGEQIVISTRRPAEQVRLDDLPLVFVGYGTTAPEREWDDFKDVDVRGKVIVVLVNDADYEQPELNTFNGRAMTYYGRWTYKYDEAARRGAAGVLVVHETAPASYGWTTVKNSWTGPQFDIVRANAAAERVPLEGWIQRDVAVDLFERAGLDFEALKVSARSRDFRPVELEGQTLDAGYSVSTSQIETHNVVARLPGTTHADETILYTGHWDHIGVGDPDAEGDRIFNGAVDNASGIAGLLEIARLYGSGPTPERSIVIIAFTAEESGLLGSEFYAANPLYPLETTVAGFNLDAMNVYGRLSGLGVTGYGQSTLDERLEVVAATQGRVIVPDTNNAAGTYFRSDHFPLAKRGVPMAYPKGSGDFRDEPIAERQALRDEYGARRYHQAADEWMPEMDFRGAAEDLEVVYAVGLALANSRDWPGWKDGSEFGPVREESAAARR
ncbi:MULTISPECIES: M28 family metallopeptidase [unclassified Brevundimonas]|jgi:Zn-dependent M28 family amino/carboxypeptidase|uniref:M28 family metallopeptidase n=1 Tax=unclassified Brevundimonas TaxID=2622653 RepID=UPI000C53BD30|nr:MULTISPECIES: M28 family metallopeptidase [unclassified Brevundimonas]MAL87688.1 peptidase M20 [Brevundimonas sp.]|tara:strand:- start:7849 stop:9504 length:1656 start_codon:yes stop_codon:yes gene_type:complete